jgi:hypothetical protein
MKQIEIIFLCVCLLISIVISSSSSISAFYLPNYGQTLSPKKISYKPLYRHSTRSISFKPSPYKPQHDINLSNCNNPKEGLQAPQKLLTRKNGCYFISINFIEKPHAVLCDSLGTPLLLNGNDSNYFFVCCLQDGLDGSKTGDLGLILTQTSKHDPFDETSMIGTKYYPIYYYLGNNNNKIQLNLNNFILIVDDKSYQGPYIENDLIFLTPSLSIL